MLILPTIEELIAEGMSSGLRKETPASLARAVSNRRRQRTTNATAAAQSTNTGPNTISSSSSSAANSVRATPSVINNEHDILPSLHSYTSPPTSTTTIKSMIHSSDTAANGHDFTTPSVNGAHRLEKEDIRATRPTDLSSSSRKDSSATTTTTTTRAVRGALSQSQQQQQRTNAAATAVRHAPANNFSAIKSNNTEKPTTSVPLHQRPKPTPTTTKTTTMTNTASRHPVSASKSHFAVATTASDRKASLNHRGISVITDANSTRNGLSSGNPAKPMLKDPPATQLTAANDMHDNAKTNGNHRMPQDRYGSSVLQHQQQQQLARSLPKTRPANLDDHYWQQEEMGDDDDVYQEGNDDDVLDVEPVQGTELIDASCLLSGTLICIRSASPLGLHLSVDHDANDSVWIASLQGMGLGRDKEVFRLEATINNYDDSMGKGQGDDDDDDDDDDDIHKQFLHYGDVVTLTCLAARDRALGVRTMKPQQGNRHAWYHQVGCFDATSEGLNQNQWTILAASRRQRPLWVGPAAALVTKPRRQTVVQAAMVRTGDSIVLRHCGTGGLLSLAEHVMSGDGNRDQDSRSFLTLVTDSYSTTHHYRQHPNGLHHADESLLSRLQQHDRMFPTEYETFQFIPSMSPPCPRWARHGLMFHSGSYLLMSDRNDSEAGHSPSEKSDLAVQQQENLLLEEVIGSLIGLEGRYVRVHVPPGASTSEDVEFRLVDSHHVVFHLSLRRLVERILPLSTAYVQVHAFAVRHATESIFGSVMQALCEALDGHLQDHVSFVNAKLDQQFQRERLNGHIEVVDSTRLTMMQLFATIQPALQTMLVLQAVCARIRDKKGGCLLNELSRLKNQVFAGDFNAQRLIALLLNKASIPYMDLLRSWLQIGFLDDPYEEFLVKRVGVAAERSNFDPGYNGDTWNQIYEIRKEHVLQMDFASSESTIQKILRTGKYWNAVGATDKVDDSSTKQDGVLELSYRMDSITFLSFVDSMYQSASHALIRLIQDDFNLFESMRTLKRYFLLDQGDFFVNFLDTAEEELSKRASQVSMSQIQHWLSMSIQRCETTGDRVLQVPSSRLAKAVASPLMPQLLRCRLASESLSEHLKSLHGQSNRRDSLESLPSHQSYGVGGLTGVEGFMLTFAHIPFPTSLVITPKAIASYQLLFRHLFIAKHIERRLVNVWRDQQVLKVFQSLQGALGPSNFLRQRMLHFSQNLIYYMMFEVIEPNWMEMGLGVFKKQEEQTVDNILDCHNDFLRRTLDACLLTNYDFVRILTKLMTTCLRFADLMKHFMNITRVVSSTLDSRSLESWQVRLTMSFDSFLRQSIKTEKRLQMKRERPLLEISMLRPSRRKLSTSH